MATRKRLTEKQAQAVIDGAVLVKAPDWSESRNWHVTAAKGTVLVVVSPSYRAGRRNGWRQHLAEAGPSSSHDHWKTREEAAVQGLMAWKRWVTTARPSAG